VNIGGPFEHRLFHRDARDLFTEFVVADYGVIK
jgi:hypothetical protein